jgi:hypothetical protein
VIIRPPNWQDVCELVALMRPQDVDELWLMSRDVPAVIVPKSVRISASCYAMRLESGPLLCLFGASVKDSDPHTAAIWELGTEAIDRHPKAFIRACKPGLRLITEDLPEVDQFFNFIPEANARSFRWLKTLGAAFSDPWTRHTGVVVRGFQITRKKALNV